MATQQGPTPDDTGLVQFEIQRGAQAEATDGLVGTVEQIVVDRNTGELRALVIRSADGRSEFELPARYVQQSTGDHVYLDLSKEQIANNPRLARPYDPNQYMPVYEGQMEPAPAATEMAQETGRPIVTDVETNSAQVVAPVTPEELPRNETPLTATQAVLSPNQAQPLGTDSMPSNRAAPGSAAAVPNATSPVGAAGGPGNQPTPSQREMRAAEQAGARGSVPEPEPSRRPGVSGEEMGGLPSTSGLGPKSSVPPSPAPPMDTVGTVRSAATFNAPEQSAIPDNAEARTTTPGMYADFTAAPEVVAPFEALPEQGMTPRPGVTNAPPVNPTREHTAGGVLQTPITDTPLTPANAGQLTVPEQQALDESQQLFRYNEIYPQEPPRTPREPGPSPAAPSTSPAAGPLGDTGPLLGKVQPMPTKPEVPLTSGYLTPTPPPTFSGSSSEREGGPSPMVRAAALAAAGIAVGAGTGVLIALLRRRARPSVAQSAASTASNVAETVSSAVGGAAEAAQDALKRLVERAQPAGADLASSVQDVANQAAESVKSAGESAAQTVSEVGATAGAALAQVNWRQRVFRWGLLLGALGGVLFAPRPGRVLRDQLAHQLNRLLSRMQGETPNPESARNAENTENAGADGAQGGGTSRSEGTRRAQSKR